MTEPARGESRESPLLSFLCVLRHATDVDHHYRLAPDHPRVVPRREMRYVARPEYRLRAVVHLNRQAPGNVILNVGASQLFVLAIGFTLSDHFHPGSSVARPNVTPATETSSSFPFGKGRVSSGAPRFFFSIFAISGYLL